MRPVEVKSDTRANETTVDTQQTREVQGGPVQGDEDLES